MFSFLKFASVNAEVTVGGFENALEVVEAEAGMGGESAYDAEAKALVYQTVEFGEFESASGDALARRSCAFRGLAARAGIGHGENRVADPVFF